MLVILPFEKDFYAKWQYEVDYVGHPLVQVIDSFKEHDLTFAKEKIIAVLPGSRKQEITTKLPIMLAVANKFPEYRFVVAKAPGIEAAFYDDFLKEHSNVQAVSDSTYSLLSKASAALVTSGTATLETALFAVPEVVCYKGSAISYAIAKRLITIKYICLVNLIMDKPVVKELIQDELTPENIEKELHELLNNKNRQGQLQDDYKVLKQLLGAGGNASANAALIISKFLSK